MVEDVITDVEERMKKSIANLQKEFTAIRTGRANPPCSMESRSTCTAPICR